MMAVSVYVDNNVWDFLFDRGMDLSTELPRKEFCVCLTREAEFEIPPMPPKKRAFVEATIKKCGIPTDVFFGFNDDSLPTDEQRVAGFDVGRWATPEELAFVEQQRTALKKGSDRRSCMQARPMYRWRRDHSTPSSYLSMPRRDRSTRPISRVATSSS